MHDPFTVIDRGPYEPRPNVHDKRYILLGANQDALYAVVAGPSLGDMDELHGAFKTERGAKLYADWLRTEYTDYEYADVVKIELGSVPTDYVDHGLEG